MDTLRKIRPLAATVTPVIALLICALAVLTLSSCDADSNDAQSGQTAVQIGSKDFTENMILGELYALALEDADIPVQRRLGLASAVVHEALVNGDVDLYPEYTGTGLLAVLQLPVETDPQVVYDTVAREYLDRYDIVWLDMAAANNSQGVVVTREISEAHNITTLSDFAREAHNIRFASQGEFDHREDALPLLREVYGPIDFQSSTIFDNALKYEVMLAGQADAAPAYTTEGQLKNPAFVLLEDDKQAWPPYNIAPIIRAQALEQHPQIAPILNAISARLSSEVMIDLNAQVDVDGYSYTEVARTFWDSIRDDVMAEAQQ